MKKNYNFAFWGTGPLAESTIYALYQNQMIPKYIITKPDSKSGRQMQLTQPIIKTWAISKNIQVLQPIKLQKDQLEQDFINFINDSDIDFHIVASYGKILPKYLLELPNTDQNIKFKYKPFINIHPSDLPDLRGPSPLQYALLRGDKDINISIIELIDKMDGGNIIIKNKIPLQNSDTLETGLRKAGNIAGQNIYNIIDLYLTGNIRTIIQDETLATYCKFIEKEQGDITNIISNKDISNILHNNNINTNIEEIKNKYRAFTPWPSIYFYIQKNDKKIRIKISQFDLTKDNLIDCILTVIPEGKKEIGFKDFLSSYQK